MATPVERFCADSFLSARQLKEASLRGMDYKDTFQATAGVASPRR